MTSDKQRKPGRIILKIFFLLLITAGIVFAVLVAFRGDFSQALDWESLNPQKLIDAFREEHSGIVESSFKFEDLRVLGSGVYMDNLLILSDSDIRLLNSKGEELWYYTHEIRQPVLQLNGRMALIYEQNGKSYMVLRDGKVLLKDKLEEMISFGEITDSRVLFITANTTGYKRTVYSLSVENGVQLGALYIDDYYPYFVQTLPKESSTNIILPGLGMNSNHITTLIRLYPGNLGSTPVTSLEHDGLYPIMYRQGQNLLFVGETGAFSYDSDLELSWSVAFDAELVAAGLLENGGAVFANQDGLSFYNNKGKEIKKMPDVIADSIETCQNITAVITGTEAVFYDSNANQICRTSLSGLTLKVHFVNEKKAFVVSEHEAVLHEIGRDQ